MSIFKVYLTLIMLGVASVISLTLLDYANNYRVISYVFPDNVDKIVEWSLTNDPGYSFKKGVDVSKLNEQIQGRRR